MSELKTKWQKNGTLSADDKKKQEVIEARNHADSLIYGTEKSLNDLGDKADAALKSDLEGKIAALRKEMEGENTDAIKAATDEGYRYVSSHSDRYDPKVQERFETIFRESVLGVDYAGHIVVIKCYPGMANAACQVFDSMQWKNVVGSLSGDDTFLVVVRSERDAKNISAELERYITRK